MGVGDSIVATARVCLQSWLWTAASRPVDTWLPLLDAVGCHAGVAHVELWGEGGGPRPITAPTFHATVTSLKVVVEKATVLTDLGAVFPEVRPAL